MRRPQRPNPIRHNLLAARPAKPPTCKSHQARASGLLRKKTHQLSMGLATQTLNRLLAPSTPATEAVPLPPLDSTCRVWATQKGKSTLDLDRIHCHTSCTSLFTPTRSSSRSPHSGSHPLWATGDASHVVAQQIAARPCCFLVVVEQRSVQGREQSADPRLHVLLDVHLDVASSSW
jgi:hypothetical protein